MKIENPKVTLARQLLNSIYKMGEYPGCSMRKFYRNPQKTLEISQNEHSVLVTCGEQFQVECIDNGTWHFIIDTLNGEYKAELYHRAHGYPLWYGRETPSFLTQHSVTYGYNWAGDGTVTYQGKTVKVKGTGQRERYVAVDFSAAVQYQLDNGMPILIFFPESCFLMKKKPEKSLILCN